MRLRRLNRTVKSSPDLHPSLLFQGLVDQGTPFWHTVFELVND